MPDTQPTPTPDFPSPAQPHQCPYCRRDLLDPDQGSLDNGLYETRCDCGAWLEVERTVAVVLRVNQCSPSVPPRIFLGR